MPEQRTTRNRSILRASWWTTAGVLLCLVAVAAWVWMYASRRSRALKALVNVELRAPGYLPAALHSWLPRWALEVSMASGATREEWAALGAFPEVEVLTFSDSDLTDDDLRLLRNLRHLVRLDLEQNPGITDAGLRHIERLPRLEHVRLWECGISDEGLKSLATLPKLQFFSVQSSRLTGTGVAHLGGAKNLSSCFLDFRSVSSASPGRFDLLPALDELRITGKGLNNESLQHLVLPPSLSCLDLTGTGLNDTGPDLVEQFARVPGIDGVDYLDLRGIANGEATRRRLCERLKLDEISPGEFHRP